MSSMYIYLKNVPEVEKLGLTLSNEAGMRRFTLYHLEVDFLPDISDNLIERVTLLDGDVYGPIRKQGIYYHNGAKLIVTTGWHLQTNILFQKMEAVGSLVAPVKNIYSLVRQGKLQPLEDWDAPMPMVSPTRSFRGFLRAKLLKFSNLSMFSKFHRR